MKISDIAEAEEYKDSVNLGIHDQLMALQWVHDNIRSFGGDPDNIMLAGDTIGAYCIEVLSTMKEANCLFKRAFLISPSHVDTDSISKLPRVSFKDLMKEFGADTMEDMLKVKTDELKKFMCDNADLYWYVPAYDDRIIKKRTDQAIKDGDSGDIKFIFGISDSETSSWITLGSEKNMYIWSNYTFTDMVKTTEGSKEIDKLLQIYEHYKDLGYPEKDAKKKSLEFWMYRYDAIKNCYILSEMRKSVRIFYWDVNSPVEMYGGNSLSAMGAFLGNDKSMEGLGYFVDRIIRSIYQYLIYNEIVKDEAKLEEGEIKGVESLEWQRFDGKDPSVLYINNKYMYMDKEIMKKEFDVVNKWAF